jgi:hypothetical protein
MRFVRVDILAFGFLPDCLVIDAIVMARFAPGGLKRVLVLQSVFRGFPAFSCGHGETRTEMLTMMARRITEVAPADEAKVVAIIRAEFARAREKITGEASWQRLEEFFYQQLVHDQVLPAVVIVAWAEAGHPAAHRAIRRYGREMKERSRFDDLIVTLRAYVIKTDEQPFVPFPRGRHLVANLMRDIWIPAMMQNAAEGTGLPATRSGTTAAPSVAYFAALAFKREGVKLKERELNRIYWNRRNIAARLEASMPAIPASSLPAISSSASKENI